MAIKMKRFLLFLFFDLVLVLSTLLAAEYILGVIDPKKNLPIDDFHNGVLYTWGQPVTVNRYYFREREFATPKPNDVYRIMVLGDSLTWGAGLALNERYTNRLESRIKKEFPDKKIEVLNFGMRGGSTTEERDNLKKFKDMVQPDFIIVGYCLNDPQPKSQDYSWERDQFSKKYDKAIETVSKTLSAMKLYHMSTELRPSIYRLAEWLDIIPPWQVGLNRTYLANSKEWLDFRKALNDIKQMSDSMHLSPPIFMVLNQGTYTDRPTNYSHPDAMLTQYLSWYHQAEKEASSDGFLTANVEKEIGQSLSGKILAINILDGHPSKELNEVYAKKLFEMVTPYLQSVPKSSTNATDEGKHRYPRL